MSATTQVYCLTLYVTYQQEVAIRELFTVKGWSFTKKGDENESSATQDESHVDTGLNGDSDNNDNDNGATSGTEGERNTEDLIADEANVMKEAVKSVKSMTENTGNIVTDNPDNDDAEVKTELDAVTDYDDGDDDDDLTSDLDYNDDESDDNNEEDSDEYLPDSEITISGRKRKVTAPKTRSKKLKSEMKGKKGTNIKTKLKTYGDKTATARRKAQKGSTSSSKSVKPAELNESTDKDEIINFDADLDVDSERLNIELELQESDDIDHYETVLKSLSPDEPFNPPTDVQESDGFSESLGCYYCHDCGYTFQLQRWYDTHKWKGRCVYRCPVCSERFTFRNISLYRTHMTAHNQETESSSNKDEVVEKSRSRKQYNCTECDYKTRWGPGLNKHIMKYHTPKSAQSSAQQDSPKLVCTECDKLFKSKDTLRSHMKFFHSSTPPMEYTCFHCDYKSKFQHLLKRHLQIHMPASERKDKRARFCKECGKEFHSASGLDSHVRDKHGKVFKYSCEICGGKYNVRGPFEKHVASHKKIPYLNCDYCEAKFRYKSKLFEHLQNEHHQNKIEYFKY